MHAIIQHWLSAAALLLAVLLSTSATAAPIVVGSINPATEQITIFQDLLVSAFQDGTPIYHIYGHFNEALQEFLMIRAGKTSEDVCQTDAFRLLRIPGNRLALAADHHTSAMWNGVGRIKQVEFCAGSCHIGMCRIDTGLRCVCPPFDPKIMTIQTCSYVFNKLELPLKGLVYIDSLE